MKKSLMILTIAGAFTLTLPGCGGDGSGGSSAAGGGGGLDTREARLGAAGSTSASGFSFVAGQEPVIQFIDITEDPFQDPPPSATRYKPGEILPLSEGRTYLLTLRANTDANSMGTAYISNTRSAAGEECLYSQALTSRQCPSTPGRTEKMPNNLVWRTIVNFNTQNNADRQIHITPVTTLVAERARVLTTPRGGELPVAEAASKAEAELRSSLLPQGEGAEQIAFIAPKLESLGDDVGSRYGLLLGALERLTQQMSKPVMLNEAAGGYSSKYDILFASFARDGRFETLQENIQGNSVGLRSVGPLLNAALTEHLIKDAPRYELAGFANFRSEDFLLSKAALALRQSLNATYSDLFDASNTAVTSISYVASNPVEPQKIQDHSITAVAARTGGVFFLDSRGEAQDGNKATVQCKPTDFGASANYEVTGVVALDGAIFPTVLAFSHTDTRAYLIDARKVGLDQATPGSSTACMLLSAPNRQGFREINFADASTQNAALYRSASQYQHSNHATLQSASVTLTSATYDSRLNKLLISTADGVLAYDINPADPALPSPGALPLTARYLDFSAFPKNSANASIGLGMNPVFDNSAGILWSPFDYNPDVVGDDDFRGLFALDYSSTAMPFSSNSKAYKTKTSADSLRLRNSALTGAFNQGHGVGSTAGVFSPPASEIMECQSNTTPRTIPYNTVRFYNLASPGIFDNDTGSVVLSEVVDLPPIGQGTRTVNNPTQGLLGGIFAPQPDTTQQMCRVGYHGVAFENRVGDRNRSATTGLYAIAPVQPAREFSVPAGLVNSVLLSSPRFTQNLNEDGSWKAIINTKPFVIFQQGPTANDPRQLVADDIRSYGVLRLRGTFPKSLAYFLVSETATTNGATGTVYSLVEADLDAIAQIPNTTSDTTSGNPSYFVPVTRQQQGAAANPVRVYFR